MTTSHITADEQRMSSFPKLYAPGENAEMLGIGLRTVRRRIRRGELAHTHLSTSGRLIRVREEDLDTFVSCTYRPARGIPGKQEVSPENIG